jgi:aryl-alcohol dehydrogenase-like predicted oxidoreductase
MQYRTLGRTGLKVSVLGFGCGAVGGLMVRGSRAEQDRAVARAVELGINYFDTAPQYGDGASESNLGRSLNTLRSDVIVGTKVRIATDDRRRIGEAVAASLEASLRRLDRDSIDLFQLHNLIALDGQQMELDPDTVLREVVPAFERLQRQGKTRFIGLTALGETTAVGRVVDERVFDTGQFAYNMLNPSAGSALPTHYPAQDYGNIIMQAEAARMGIIAIRVLAGGALSGIDSRHPLGASQVDPIGSGTDYQSDVRRATRLKSLVQEGQAKSLIELALRFVISNKAITTALVGYSSLEHLEIAADAVAKGPLTNVALKRLRELQATFIGEAR